MFVKWANIYRDILFQSDYFEDLIEAKYVKEIKHPELPLVLLDYTNEAQFSRNWDPRLRIARGLILEINSKNPAEVIKIVANPFPRFANLGEIKETEVNNLPDNLFISNKLDGSLVICWYYNYKWYFSTRGSFKSKQSLDACLWFNEHFSTNKLDPSYTYLFEWISPDNRIVVNYGDRKELVLLAVRKTEFGEEIHPSELKYFAKDIGVNYIEFNKFKFGLDKIEFGEPTKDEGRVLYSHSPYLRVKVKSPEYVKLHKDITNLCLNNSKWTIFDLVKNNTLHETIRFLPQEYKDMVLERATELLDLYNSIISEAKLLLERTKHLTSRKEKALLVNEIAPKISGVFFSLLENREEEAKVRAWRIVAKYLEEKEPVSVQQ